MEVSSTCQQCAGSLGVTCTTLCSIPLGWSPRHGVGHPLKPGHLKGHWKPVGPLSKGKKASSSLGESLPANYIKEKDHGLLWGVKCVLNVQICINLFQEQARYYFHCHHRHRHLKTLQEAIVILFLSNNYSWYWKLYAGKCYNQFIYSNSFDTTVSRNVDTIKVLWLRILGLRAVSGWVSGKAWFQCPCS